MQLEPQGRLTIVRTIDDPLDTNTYYVRAYIRKSLTDALIDTVDLTDRGGRRFTYRDYRLPADPSGEGLDLDITTKVFTDATHTTPSDVYGDDNKQYILAKRYNPVYRGGELAGTAAKLDYNKLKKILRKVVKKEIGNIPESKELDPMLITGPIVRAIDDIYIPPQKEVNLGGLIRLVGKAIMAIEAQPAFEKTDLTEVYAYLDRIRRLGKKRAKRTNKLIKKKHGIIDSVIDEKVKEIKDIKFMVSANPTKKKKIIKKRKGYRKYL